MHPGASAAGSRARSDATRSSVRTVGRCRSRARAPGSSPGGSGCGWRRQAAAGGAHLPKVSCSAESRPRRGAQPGATDSTQETEGNGTPRRQGGADIGGRAGPGALARRPLRAGGREHRRLRPLRARPVGPLRPGDPGGPRGDGPGGIRGGGRRTHRDRRRAGPRPDPGGGQGGGARDRPDRHGARQRGHRPLGRTRLVDRRGGVPGRHRHQPDRGVEHGPSGGPPG